VILRLNFEATLYYILDGGAEFLGVLSKGIERAVEGGGGGEQTSSY
jgi:hypothetical protein